MSPTSIWLALTCPEAEKDEQFQAEIERRSVGGLRVIGWLLVAIPAVMVMVVHLVTPELSESGASVVMLVAVMGVGAGALVFERLGRGTGFTRQIGWAVAFLAACCLIVGAILRAAGDPALLYLVNAQVAVIILVTLATQPLKPIHVLALGISIQAMYAAATQVAVWLGALTPPPSANVNLVFMSMLTLMSTVVAVNTYCRLIETHQSHQAQLRAAEEFRDAQCRMLMNDSAASMGRLAAALSHELNNPLGALRSSVDTLRNLSARENLPAEKRAGIERPLWETAGGSIDRIHGIVRRIQRYTNLDRAEEMPVDLNLLVTDVAEIVSEAMEGKVRFDLHTQKLPDVQGRPQALSAVFSGLMNEAAQAAGDTGVRVETRAVNGKVEVAVSGANGWPGESPEELDPGFGVKEGRMAACNWSLFSAAQIVRRHGGELVVDSSDSRVVVRLPV